MTDIRHCPTCGAELSESAPDEPCPACLMKLGAGLESGTKETGSSEAPTRHYSDGFEAPAVEELSSRFPQFEMLELVGKGGMGAVYKARQKSLDRIVAVKIINPEAADRPGFGERFAREARAMARMNHANIVTIHDFGEAPAASSTGESEQNSAQALFYFVMEYVEGTNLRALLRQKRLEPREALAVIPPLCDALQYAHEEGIVHRDIKPENILIDRKGRVKIADFGLAKLLGRGPRDVTLTEAFQALGTMHYMAPEQFERPLEVDHRADIYALGVTLYEMLTGELPIGRFAPPSQKVEVDVRLDEIVLRTLEREPERRYQHASEVKTAVESCSAVPGGGPGHDEPTQVVPMRLRAPAIGLIVYGALTLFVLGIYVLGSLEQWETEGLDVVLREARALGPTLLTGMALSVPVGILAIIAGMRMQRYQSRGLAIVASILATVTPVLTIVLGLPIGIWALVVLNLSSVRAGYAQAERQRSANAQQRTPVPPSPNIYAPGTGPRMLAIALGFITSSLCAAVGVALLTYGSMLYSPGEGTWAGFMGGGFGTLIGGIGGLVGCWNGLRMMRGKLDLMHEPAWTWFDTAMLAYAIAGIGGLTCAAIWWSSLNLGLKITIVVLSGIATFQALWFSIWRMAMRRAAVRVSAQPAFDLRLIVIAIGMLLCAMSIAGGAVLFGIALIKLPVGSPGFWGWIGAAFGCFLGGAGGLIGIWNTYRSLEGLPDWIADPQRNTLDRYIYGIALLGALLMASGLAASPWINDTSVYAVELLGGILVFQAALFLPVRALMRRAARQEAERAKS